MSDTKNSVLPDIIEPMSNAIQQNIPETAKQADGALSTVVGFFNNVVLYPVKKANLTFRYKMESFEDDLKKKSMRKCWHRPWIIEKSSRYIDLM